MGPPAFVSCPKGYPQALREGNCRFAWKVVALTVEFGRFSTSFFFVRAASVTVTRLGSKQLFSHHVVVSGKNNDVKKRFIESGCNAQEDALVSALPWNRNRRNENDEWIHTLGILLNLFPALLPVPFLDCPLDRECLDMVAKPPLEGRRLKACLNY